jgi:hypothetical protein
MTQAIPQSRTILASAISTKSPKRSIKRVTFDRIASADGVEGRNEPQLDWGSTIPMQKTNSPNSMTELQRTAQNGHV